MNVTSYGATGNGVTLDTAAIISALAVNDTILFPPGVYKIGSMTFPADRTIFFENNARILIASAANVVWNSRIVASEDQWIFDCEDQLFNLGFDSPLQPHHHTCDSEAHFADGELALRTNPLKLMQYDDRGI